MTIEDEIAESQGCISEPPKNELTTCNWIILPLLLAAGYSRRDIEAGVVDSTRQFPDYTLLPNHSSATYYLEAKAWNVTLEDIHIKQALNYANQNGKRFVVLTNGQNWRLYDNSIQGLLADKLIRQAALRDTLQITTFLTTLSKPEVMAGSLERISVEECQRRMDEAHNLQEQQKREEELKNIYERQAEIKCLLSATLPSLLNDPNSELVVLITEYLSNTEEFIGISSESISVWFDKTLLKPLVKREVQAIEPHHAQMMSPFVSEQQGRTTWTLKELQGRPINGKTSRLIALQAPDGTLMSVGKWVQLAIDIVSWIFQQPRPMPLPFASSNRNRWFLNHVPEHKRSNLDGKFAEISAHGKTIYMDKDSSAVDLLKDIYALCLAMQIDPDMFQVTVLF